MVNGTAAGCEHLADSVGYSRSDRRLDFVGRRRLGGVVIVERPMQRDGTNLSLMQPPHDGLRGSAMGLGSIVDHHTLTSVVATWRASLAAGAAVRRGGDFVLYDTAPLGLRRWTGGDFAFTPKTSIAIFATLTAGLRPVERVNATRPEARRSDGQFDQIPCEWLCDFDGSLLISAEIDREAARREAKMWDVASAIPLLAKLRAAIRAGYAKGRATGVYRPSAPTKTTRTKIGPEDPRAVHMALTGMGRADRTRCAEAKTRDRVRRDRLRASPVCDTGGGA
jgi:hypothetical protein